MKRTVKYKVAFEGKTYKASLTIPGGYMNEEFIKSGNLTIAQNIHVFIINTLFGDKND